MKAADAKLEYSDRMGALREYEKALKDNSLDVTARKTLLFNSCCLHASFGDLELAQVGIFPPRNSCIHSIGVLHQAVTAQDAEYEPWSRPSCDHCIHIGAVSIASTDHCVSCFNTDDVALSQVPLRDAIGLGLDFEQALQNPDPGMLKLKASQQVVIALKRFAKTVGKITKERAEYNPVKGMQLTPAGVRTAMSQEDISNIVGTDMRGAGMDKTLLGILKRVALLLLALVGLGAGLYVVGLKVMFPDGI